MYVCMYVYIEVRVCKYLSLMRTLHATMSQAHLGGFFLREKIGSAPPQVQKHGLLEDVTATKHRYMWLL